MAKLVFLCCSVFLAPKIYVVVKLVINLIKNEKEIDN